MVDSNTVPIRFIALEEVVKNALMNIDESSPHLYAKMFYYSIDGLAEMEYDVIDNLKDIYLKVDPTTKSAVLPEDFVQQQRVGMITQNNEIQDLALNDNMIFPPVDQPECHCSCGCNSELCYALTESNLITTTESVVINGTSYDKTTTVCTNEDGDVIQRICQPTITNPTKTCNYNIIFTRVASELENAPWSNFKFTKNGVDFFVGDVSNSALLTSIMSGNGFSLVSSTVTAITYNLAATTDVWQTATYTDSLNVEHVVDFEQTGCVTPEPTVETICYDEKICKVETEECGCVTLNDTVINTISQWSTCFQEFIQRDLQGMDWQKTLSQPLSWFGYYSISKKKNVIQLDQNYPWDTVYLLYTAVSVVDSNKFLVPVVAKQALVQYCKWKYKESKNNISDSTKTREGKQFYNEKKKAHGRLHPFNLANMLDRSRQNPRP